MKARDIMTRRIHSIESNATVLQAVRLMLQHKISGLPVVDANWTLLGIVTEGDFLRRTETATERKRPRWLEFLVGPGRLADDYVQTHAQRVAEVMTPDPHTVAEDTPLEEIVQLMEKKHIKRVPVMRGKKLVGIISRANLLHALASMAPTATAQAPNDHAIRERLLAELEGEKWAPVGALDIIVRDGVVELWGSITDERERKALIVAAENIPGVKAVRDHLVWVDTMTDMVFNPPNEAKAS